MPLPTTITWFLAHQGVENLAILDQSNHLVVSISLIDCHEEILARRGEVFTHLESSGVEVRSDLEPINYYLRRSAWIQERLLHLYLSAISSGVSNEGYFYGAFNEVGTWQEVESVRLYGNPVYLMGGQINPIHRIGLLYT
jgi:hypothetical protein